MANKFTVVKNRLMTPDEVRERAKEMNLGVELTEYLVKEFEQVQEDIDSGALARRGYDSDVVIGTNGRIACGQSWEGACEQLAIAMGIPEDEAWDAGPVGENAEVQRVWDAFYEE